MAVRGASSKAVGTHFHLAGALLAGDVQRLQVGAGQGDLEREGGFAYSGLTAYEHQRPRDNSASQDAVHLGVAKAYALLAGRGYVRELLGAIHAAGCRGTGLCGTCLKSLLNHCIPLSTSRAATHPFGTFVSAGGAVPYRFAL